MSQQRFKPAMSRSRSTELDKICGSNLIVWFVWREWPVQRANPFCCCLFGLNVDFNNFSVIQRRCLVATGSSVLTLIVLRHWSIMPQALDTIPHPVTLSWHCLDQSQLFPVSLSARRGAASTIFKDLGMSRSGIEPVTPSFPERTLYRLSYRGRYTPCVHIKKPYMYVQALNV